MSLICRSDLGRYTGFRNWTWQFGCLTALWPVHHIWEKCRWIQKPSDQSLLQHPLQTHPTTWWFRGDMNLKAVRPPSKLRELCFSPELLRKIRISELHGSHSASYFCLNLSAHFSSCALRYLINRQVHLSQCFLWYTVLEIFF